MQHTLVAVFDNRTDAQNAMNELLSSGFSRQDVRLSNADPTGQTDSVTGREDEIGESSTGIGASIKNFFHDLFGSDNAIHASRYEGAVTRGHHVLTLTADSLPEVERAADIVERYGPTDIDEQASGFGDVPSSAGAMRMGTSSGMSSSPMSAQSGTPGSSGSQSLQNAGDRKLYQQQSLNQAEPMGGTYQEPMGKSGLGATGSTSLQGSTLQENSVQGSSLEGTQSSGLSAGSLQGSSLEGSASTGSQQRASAGSGSSIGGTQQRSGVRIFSRGTQDMDDDSYYRSHFSSTYGVGSESYDDYLPAYSYGSEMARSGTYAGRKWDEVENDLRTGWESRSGGTAGSTWERMKAAVRRGWDRITSDDDDDYYRNHFSSTYDSSSSYDDYAPAYRYGSEMRRSPTYASRSWDEAENDLRSGWESRTGDKIEATWERMKAAVRRGWDRITPDDDDDYYRSHYSSTYAATGKTFSDYAPAYSYGSEMARSELYRNRPWDDVETDLRSDWETRRASSTGSTHSTWENMKDAVKRGWERLTRDEDDEYYRTHWTNTYGATGSSYDEYQPAYSFGSRMRSDPRYSGRQWDEVESDLRSDWETRYPGESTWERMKAAVRHGWNRMTH